MPYKSRIAKNRNYKEWYAIPENKRRTREQVWERNWKYKITVFDLYNWRCKQCGFSDWRALQIDHINGGGTEERKRMGHNLYTLCRRVLENPESYQLLCANCNWIKRYTHDEAPMVKDLASKVEAARAVV